MKFKIINYPFFNKKGLLRFIMRTFILLFCTSVFSFSTSTIFSQNVEVVIDEDKTITIDEVFDLLRKQTDFAFIYHEDLFENLPKIHLKKGKIEANELLKKILSTKKFNFDLRNKNTIIIKEIPVIVSQQYEVKGSVTDSNGQPLPGANILEKGTQNGAQTDFDGKFSISLANKNASLAISYVGFSTKEIRVGEQTTLSIVLQEDAADLDEIVLIGYGSARKSDLTGAVSSLRADDFENQPLTTVTEALQGRASGVQISNFNGAPGAAAKIRIRGANSLTGSSNPLVVIDGIIGGNLNVINPSDIESIQVLKDASSTAVYGSRGANGVVLVSTKKGKSEIPVLNFDTFLGVQSVSKKIDLLNGAQFAQTINDKRAITGGQPAFTSAQIDALRQSGGTDWQDVIFRDAIRQNYQLSISAKKPGVDYYISGNYTTQEGIIINSDYERFSLRSNIGFDLTDKVKINLNIYGTREIGLNNTPISSLASPVAGALTFDPTAPVFQPDGTPTVNSTFGSLGTSPYASATGIERENITNRYNANGSLIYTISNHLTFTSSIGISIQNATSNSFQREFASNSGSINGSKTAGEIKSFHNFNILKYKKEFNDKHKLSVEGIFEQQYVDRSGFNATGQGFSQLAVSVGVNNLGLAPNQIISSFANNEALHSYLGRLEYAFNDTYLFTATFRADGSSKFPKNNRYGYFPSAAIAWKLSNEDFIKNMDVFSNLKLRASYGVTGNQAISPFSSLGRLITGNSANAILNPGTISIGVAPGTLDNPNLKWEETKQFDFGLDVGILNGRLNLTADYYKKKTEDLLLNINTPSFTGVSSILKNVGKVENKGFEIDLHAYIINDENFKWESSFNFAKNETIATDLGGEDRIFPGGTFGAGVAIGPAIVLEVGKPVGDFYGFIYDGVWQTSETAQAATFGNVPGDSKFRDIDGDGIINNNDLAVIGNGQPDFIWGFNNDFTYKGLSLNIFLQAMQGHDVLNLVRGYTFGGNADARDATTIEILDRWTPQNQDSNISGFSSTSREVLQSSRYVEDGSFVRLKNVTLAYNFPKSFLEKSKFISGAKIYISGQNLATWTDYKGFDPEVSSGGNSDIDQSIDWGSYPSSRTITVGANLSF